MRIPCVRLLLVEGIARSRPNLIGSAAWHEYHGSEGAATRPSYRSSWTMRFWEGCERCCVVVGSLGFEQRCHP
jgi:hypothetical protein